jgi:outer membrane lipoprotein-sorting protein
MIGALAIVELLAIRPLHAAPAPSLPDARALYARRLTADQMVSYKGHQVTTDWRTGRSVSVEVYHRAPMSRRIAYLAPERLRGMVIVTNHAHEWAYHPATKTVVYRRYQMDSTGFEDANTDYGLLERNYRIRREEQVRVWADRKCAIVNIGRKRGPALARRLWFDLATGLLLKSEHYDETGKLCVTVAYPEIDFHAQLPKELFDPNTLIHQPGVRLVNAPAMAETPVALASIRTRLGGLAAAPANINGYQLVAAAVSPSPRGDVLHLTYSDGLSMLSLFEKRRMNPQKPTRVENGSKVRVGGREGSVAHHSAINTLNWDAGPINWTLMGEVSLRSLVAFADAADDAVK